MTALCAGIDLSMSRLHAALIPLDPDTTPTIAVHFRETRITGTGDQRLDNITPLIRELLRPTYDGDTVEVAYVEKPKGRWRSPSLDALYGATRNAIPNHITRDGFTPSEWRSELGIASKYTKERGIQEARDWIYRHDPRYEVTTMGLDEHYAEALLIALAGRQRNYRLWAEGVA